MWIWQLCWKCYRNFTDVWKGLHILSRYKHKITGLHLLFTSFEIQLNFCFIPENWRQSVINFSVLISFSGHSDLHKSKPYKMSLWNTWPDVGVSTCPNSGGESSGCRPSLLSEHHHASSTNISASLWWNHFYSIHPSINFMVVKRQRPGSSAFITLCLPKNEMRAQPLLLTTWIHSLRPCFVHICVYFVFKKRFSLLASSLCNLYRYVGLQADSTRRVVHKIFSISSNLVCSWLLEMFTFPNTCSYKDIRSWLHCYADLPCTEHNLFCRISDVILKLFECTQSWWGNKCKFYVVKF